MAHELIDAFEIGLRTRPDDFVAKTHDSATIYTITDSVTGVEWWVANEAYGIKAIVRDDGAEFSEGRRVFFGFWDRRRAWRAFKVWRRDHFRPGPTMVERAAAKMREANARVGDA